MFRLMVALAAAVACVVGCSTQQTTGAPQMGPRDDSTNSSGRDSEAINEPYDPNAIPLAASPKPPEGNEATSLNTMKQSEASGTATNESAASAAELSSGASNSRKSCSGLTKTICEITMGCAWSSTKVCVTQ
jgi:hypothetical protein